MTTSRCRRRVMRPASNAWGSRISRSPGIEAAVDELTARLRAEGVACSTVRVALATVITRVSCSIRKAIGSRSPPEPVRAWRRAGAAREEAREVRRIGESAGLGNQRDAHVRVEQACVLPLAVGVRSAVRAVHCRAAHAGEPQAFGAHGITCGRSPRCSAACGSSLSIKAR
jgi:hypothetical protein